MEPKRTRPLYRRQKIKEKISLQDLVKNTKKIYMVLVPYHYFIIKNGIIIDYSGEYYYQMKNKIAVHCYWEFRN